ncbi:MAG: hypothetical protein RLZZ367_268 [Bacteroidota bacterium]|jgi:membrane protease YdiL (CAAX protease family)
MNPPFKNYPLVLRILLMFSMFVFNVSVLAMIGTYLSSFLFGMQDIQTIVNGRFTTPEAQNAVLFIQGFTSLGGFALTAIMFAVLESGEFKKHLRINNYPDAKMVLLAIASVLVAQFFVEFLVTINKLVVLPAKFQFLYDAHKRNEELAGALMNFTDVAHFIVATLVVAVVPAIGEEFFFRGLLLGDLLKGKVPMVAALLFSGFVFAVFHFEVDNVLAIWVMGIFLGYLYYISGSLWLPIAAHFTNNFLAVLFKYLYNTGAVGKDFAEAETPLYASLISIAVFIGFVFIFNKWKKPATFVEPVQPIETNNTY